MAKTDARSVAYDILNELDTKKSTLDHLVFEKYERSFQKMSARDRNLAFALVYGVLRTRGQTDWIIGRFSKTSIKKIDSGVLNLLRIALFQVFFMTKIPESAAVSTAVELAKKSSPPWVVKFVNGLLRNIVRNTGNIKWPDKNTDPILWISVNLSFPQWIVRRWIDRFGFEETQNLCCFYNTIPPLSIRTNTKKISQADLMERLRPAAEKVQAAEYAPDAILVYGLKVFVSELDAFKEGLFQVQDEAAQLVSHVLDPQPGETVMDACSGLGGKTGQIASLMKNTGKIAAVDNHSKRLAKLKIQMKRLGISNVSILHRDLNRGIAPGHRLLYDRVLLDAPCSGTGVIRRNPDTRWLVTQKDFSRFRKNQLCLLNSVAPAIKPGGILVYAVCSIEPEETGEVVAGFMQKHPEFAARPLSGIACGFPGATVEKGYVMTLPHKHRMDGFFIAAFKKNL